MTREHFANRIRQTLNQGTRDLPSSIALRLEKSRRYALAHQKQEVAQHALATPGHHFHWPSGSHQHTWPRHILSVLALLVGMWIAFYWHSDQYIRQIEELDSALLADDLPPEAFLDTGFFKWLQKNNSSEE